MADGIVDETERLKTIAGNLRGSFQTMEEMATEFIREAILRGMYRPGQRLQQDQIAELLGVSRMPVRSSLRKLETEGLVVFHPYRGATVRLLTPEEIEEIYELRILLESHALEQAASHLTSDVLEELGQVAKSAEDETDSSMWLEHRREFYETLYSLAGLPRTLQLITELRREVGPYLVMRDVAADSSHGHHLVVLDYLQAGDIKGAKKALAEHFDEVSQDLQRIVTEAQAPA